MPVPWALPCQVSIVSDLDDGEEVDDATWDPAASPLVLGRDEGGSVHDLGLRFLMPPIAPGDSILFARLRFASRGGEITDSLVFSITGAREVSSPPLSGERRPSQLPHTESQLLTTVTQSWVGQSTVPLFYYTEDISPIINEIISLPGWGVDSAAIVLCLDDASTAGTPANTIACSEYGPGWWPVTLQLCRTPWETFLCHEILGRPTDHSVTLNFTTLVPLEVFVKYGTWGPDQISPVYTTVPGEPFELVLDGLQSDAEYSYLLLFRVAGSNDPFRVSVPHRFHTQRDPASSFTFTVQADSHIWQYWVQPDIFPQHDQLYRRTLRNVRDDAPDFHFSLGDFSLTEYALTAQNAEDRYALQREYLDTILHSIPFYLVIGNHEGELGWLRNEVDLPAWAEAARLRHIVNPSPDDFYSGCADSAASGPDLRESYFAWEWGDALFVVLDPFWYTMNRPYHNSNPNQGGGWAWTLGKDQYRWLHQVINESDRTWKIVLLHHLVGGLAIGDEAYGRGGIEVARYEVAHRPSFEWGGQDSLGINVFSLRRPGWRTGPIHEMLVRAGVRVVLHGHDHFCAVQQLDGITYIECPQPMDPSYGYGAMAQGAYTEGTLRPNSGHLRFRVGPEDLTVEYIRAFIDGNGGNGDVCFSYTLPQCLAGGEVLDHHQPNLRVSPNPASSSTALHFQGFYPRQLRILDASGRHCVTLRPREDGLFVWDRVDARGRPVSPGIYYCNARWAGRSMSQPLVVVR